MIHMVNKNLIFVFNYLSFFKDSNVLCKVLEGHTDAVWQLALSGHKLLSCSSDGSIRLWDSNLTVPLQSTFNSKFCFFFFICNKNLFR
jgi:WD40 repeat protein